MRSSITSLSWLLASALLSCQVSEDTASTKFITLAGVGEELYQNYLIRDVKEPSWLIHYGFSDNNYCRTRGTGGEFEKQIKDSIRKVITLWLEPLRELDNDIVNDFTLKLVKTERDSRREEVYPERKPRKLVESGETPHVKYIFYCGEEDKSSPLSFALTRLKEAHIHPDYDKVPNAANNRLTDERIFLITSALHETGHVFGLADTYPDSNQKSIEISELPDTGDSEYTLGKQPLGIMGIANLLGVRPQTGAYITADDAEGIRWLYRLTHKNASSDECPEDYVIEPATKGCIPRHPFILAVRNGDGRQVQRLSQDSNLDINACDQYGRTALFYAEQYRLRHGGGKGTEKFLLSKGADPAMTCPDDETLTSTTTNTETADAETQGEETAPASCGTLKHSALPEHPLLLLLAFFALLPKSCAAIMARQTKPQRVV